MKSRNVADSCALLFMLFVSLGIGLMAGSWRVGTGVLLILIGIGFAAKASRHLEKAQEKELLQEAWKGAQEEVEDKQLQ